jgi:shikimate dehydrogenase
MQELQPDRYGVVGHPVSHSRSPFIHGLFARQTAQELVYRLHDVEPDEFAAWTRAFFAEGGSGLNITVPHKQAAFELAEERTPRAERAQAVNTLMRQPGGQLLGDNTDGAGLLQDLRRNLGFDLLARRVIVLGAGGATRGILEPLLNAGPAEVVIANRTPERAHALAAQFADIGNVRGCSFDELPLRPFDLVINATSAALAGGAPNVNPAVIGPATFCYDLSYGRGDTPFTKWAWEQGCRRAVQGWGMLVEQAAESFELWRGVRPDTAPVLAALAAENP